MGASKDVAGLIEAVNKKGGLNFSPYDQQLLELLGMMLAVVKKRAGLGQSASSNAARTAAVFEVAQSMSRVSSIDALLGLVSSTARDIVFSDRASVFLIDTKTSELYTKVTDGTEKIRIPLQTGVVGAVATSGVAEVIDDAYMDVRFNADQVQDASCSVLSLH